MDVRSLPLGQALGEAMAHHSRRQQVIAENIANADTPGFRARDVAPAAFGEMVDAAVAGGPRIARPVVALSARAVALGGAPAVPALLTPTPREVEPNGNGVTLESELMNMADAQAAYAAAASLWRKSLGLIRAALGR